MRENERKLTFAERIRRIDPYRLRHRMVQDLGKRGITDQRVLAVMDRLPRHLFVDEAAPLHRGAHDGASQAGEGGAGSGDRYGHRVPDYWSCVHGLLSVYGGASARAL